MNNWLSLRQVALAGMWSGLLLIAGSAALAQNAPAQSPSTNPGQPPPPQVGPTADSYAVSLSTGEIINITSDQDVGNASSGQPPISLTEYTDGLRTREQAKEYRREFFYGVSVASAYTSAYAALGIPSQVSTTISPYMALMMPTKTGSFILQYDAVVNPHDSSVLGKGPQAYQAFSLTAQGAMSRRLSWTLIASGGYGSEATRLEGPLTFSVVQNIPVLDASSTVLLPATNVLFFANTARLIFQKNERNSFGFTLVHTYTGIDGDPSNPNASGQHSNALGVKVDYEHVISTRLALTSYADEETVLSGSPCYTYGGGVGLSARLTRAISLDVAGGPQFTSAGCGGQQGANFSAILVGHVNQKDRVYLSASRQFTTAYQTRGTWQDNVAAGFSKSMGRATFATDAGFVRETLVNAPAYHGYFVAPRLHVKIVNSLGFTAGYRAFRVTGGGLPSGVLNFAAVSLDWYPAGVRLK
jgi:hypothetical protein